MSEALSGREMARQLDEIRRERAQLVAHLGEQRQNLYQTPEFRELSMERDTLERALQEARERLEFTHSEAERLRSVIIELRGQRKLTAKLASRWRTYQVSTANVCNGNQAGPNDHA